MNETSTKPTALVTGASRGLGAALALELAARDVHVIAVARTTGALEELDDRIKATGGSATLAPIDITDNDAVAHLCYSIHQRWGQLDLLVHSAIHAPPLCPAAHIDARDLDKTIATNIRATALLIVNAEPLLKAAKHSKALFFDDPLKGEKFHTTYGMSKAAQIQIASNWQAECAKSGPSVKILTPAPMPTATRARFYPGENRDALTACQSEAKRLLDAAL